MNYLIYGTDNFLVKKEIDKIIKESNCSSLAINNYNLEETSITSILQDAETISLFDDKKILVADNAYFFTGSTKKIVIEHNIKDLEEYLNHENESTILILVVNYEKLDERKKIVKTFKKNGKVIDCNKVDNVNEYVKKMLYGYNIDNSTVSLLIDRVGNDLFTLENETNKIKLYKLDDKNITKEDIVNLTIKSADLDIFHLIENIVNNDKDSTLSAYHEMLKQNEEPIKIIIMLANQFRIIYQAKQLYKQGYTESNIASILKIHPYRIKLALSKGREFKEEDLLKYLSKLADLDINIKTGKVMKDLALELFILEL